MIHVYSIYFNQLHSNNIVSRNEMRYYARKSGNDALLT